MQFFSKFGEALERNAKSTVLKSLAGLVATLCAATLLSSTYSPDKWLVVMFAVLTAVSIIIYLAAYVYFALTAPDQLRSENFAISKMAIEKGFLGDDLSGVVKISSPQEPLTIADSSEEEGKKAK